jgi:hypothetical protein
LLAVKTDCGFGSADLMRGLFGQVEGVISCHILEFGRLLAFYTTINMCRSRLEGVEEVIGVEVNVQLLGIQSLHFHCLREAKGKEATP